MAIEFTNKPTKWENDGAEPSTELKKNGFQAGYKPPAGIFNHHWSESAKCIEELQTKLSGVDDKVDSITVPIIDNLESDSTTSALSAKQGKVLDTALAAKVDKKGAVALIDEYLTDSLPADIKNTAIVYMSYVLAALVGRTSPKSTTAIPIGNGDSTYGVGIKKGHLILKEGSVCVDSGDVAAYTNGTVHKLSNKLDKIDGKGLSANDFTSEYKTKLDNLDTNLNAKVINGSDLSSLTLTVSSTIPTTLAAGTICFIPEA